MIAEKPNMDHAGANVNLTITSSYLNLVSMETGEVSKFVQFYHSKRWCFSPSTDFYKFYMSYASKMV